MPNSVSTATGQSPDKVNQALRNLQSVMTNMCLASPAIAIATAKAKVKTVAAVRLLIDGALVAKAATDDAFTLSGTVVNATFNVYVLTLNAAGTCTARMGTAGATLAAVTFPVIPATEVVIGFVIVNPTGTGNFVGGTTELDDATVVPNAFYVNTPWGFNPNAFTLPNDV